MTKNHNKGNMKSDFLSVSMKQTLITFFCSLQPSYILNTDLCLSVRTFSHIRKDVNTTVGYKCIPEYRHLLRAKPDLRPPGIVISEKGDDAQCPMKNVLEFTVKRLCKATGKIVYAAKFLGMTVHPVLTECKFQQFKVWKKSKNFQII